MRENRMARMILFGLAVLALVAPAFADVGPSPPAPEVVVHLVRGGAPVEDVTEMTYHCMGVEEGGDDGAVSPQTAKLACSGGTCTNSGGWYYKFNPCFGFPSGHFSYDLGGKTVVTGTFNNTEAYSKYEMTVDADTGRITSTLGSTVPGCLGAALLAGIALFAYRR